MDISFEYDEEKNIINAKCPKILTDKAVETYFKEILSKRDVINGAHEIADFTEVEEFKTGSDNFYNAKTNLYKIIVKDKILVKTTFKVKNAYQYGMARMYCSLARESNNEFDFEFIGWKPD